MITDEMKKAVLATLDSGRFVNGPRVERFEEEFAAYCNSAKATAVNSGTAAIYLALRALNIGPGDEVVCPSFSFIATATPILLVGAIPVFVDVNEDYIIDVEDLKRKLGKKTKAVIVVHLYGQMADMDEIMTLRRQHGFFLIEDACQAHGAEYNNQKAGSFGDLACFSFYPSKNITVAGEGGMIVCNDVKLDTKLKALRNHGITYNKGNGIYTSNFLGFNFRMSEISAAIGTIQLKHLNECIELKREIAREYTEYLPVGVIKPRERKHQKHTYHLYVIRAPKRDKLRRLLHDEGIETGVHYPIPIHRQPLFSLELDLPQTDELCQQIISLPMYPNLMEEHVKYICQRIKAYLEYE
jgi:dTDP-4-amino-4,6-dideoxygalactose transaminase